MALSMYAIPSGIQMAVGPEFYAAAAQVIPTLLLTFFVERSRGWSRLVPDEAVRQLRNPLGRHAGKPTDVPFTHIGSFLHAWWTIFLMFTLVLAEALALAGVLGTRDPWVARIIVLCVGIALFQIMAPSILRPVASAVDRLAHDGETTVRTTAVMFYVWYSLAFVLVSSPLLAAIWVAIAVL